ncbi:class I SAM-dependent methyltransferase [Speluncibacter jeojiensis]|uniref:Class I SAM-dependent methyltransferase n=1 Tax=Speluncibacter jeojiensis TaxID=2710754 RepID=A0A9X4RCH9_9ACTN|nr:class I SAM-dependent methyltransferase [Corynebacteriales bacterium D3-21]
MTAEDPIDVLYRDLFAGVPCWVSSPDGTRRPLPWRRYLGGALSTPADRFADSVLLQPCAGPTLDLGCGPGRFTAALARRGVPSLGIDLSSVAVQMTIHRGGAALQRDIFAPLPNLGLWAHVLLADGNIGIGGDPLRMLRRVRELLAPNGILVAEIDPPATGLSHEVVRWENARCVGEWFPWSRVGSETAGPLAHAAGLRVRGMIEASGRYFIHLTRE